MEPSIWTVVLVGAIGTFMWRALGVLVGAKIRQDSALFNWISCIAYAMVAGLMARVLLMPGGEIHPDQIPYRLSAFLVGLGAWYVFRKSVPLGLLAGVATFSAITYLS